MNRKNINNNHKHIIKCSYCGFEWEYDLSTNRNIDRPLKILVCPKCNEPIDIKNMNNTNR